MAVQAGARSAPRRCWLTSQGAEPVGWFDSMPSWLSIRSGPSITATRWTPRGCTACSPATNVNPARRVNLRAARRRSRTRTWSGGAACSRRRAATSPSHTPSLQTRAYSPGRRASSAPPPSSRSSSGRRPARSGRTCAWRSDRASSRRRPPRWPSPPSRPSTRRTSPSQWAARVNRGTPRSARVISAAWCTASTMGSPRTLAWWPV